MNVVIYNQQDNIINGLNIEISKAIKGEFKVEDIIKTFMALRKRRSDK